jgi:hypothetical protein
MVWHRGGMHAAAWEGPPNDILGHPAPIQQFVARTDHAVVALQQVIAFPEGCSLTVHVAVRRGSLEESAWERLHASLSREDRYGTPTDADLKLGVRFLDGSKATTIDNALRGWARPTDRPEPPMLIEVGSGSTITDQFYQSDRQLWLWPLPPPGPLEFVIEWRSMGIAITATTLDGAAIVRAAERALPYWP